MLLFMPFFHYFDPSSLLPSQVTLEHHDLPLRAVFAGFAGGGVADGDRERFRISPSGKSPFCGCALGCDVCDVCDPCGDGVGTNVGPSVVTAALVFLLFCCPCGDAELESSVS